MAKYYKLDDDLIVNTIDGAYTIPAGQYVLTEATGALTACTEKKLQSEIQRVNLAISERDALIEQERLAREQEQQQEIPVEGEGYEENPTGELETP